MDSLSPSPLVADPRMSGPGNTIFSSKEHLTPKEIGAFLIKIGEKMQNEGAFTLTQGNQVLEVHPKGPTRLELEYEIKGDKHEFEIEVEWYPNREGVGAVEVT